MIILSKSGIKQKIQNQKQKKALLFRKKRIKCFSSFGFADMAELVDATDLKSVGDFLRAGSIPAFRTNI